MHIDINAYAEANNLEFIDKKSKLCAGDAQARYLAWKMKQIKRGTI